ncbi:MAG: glutamate-1-semialdehyde-2,1-aminomutase [Candidatus Eisenbacteria bacterium]|uniref:Glutamate-1-semialdehyde 2,1-aminomutase n=1 Tax=Eiseniibacteriota bacterium TaxID=2212470 RepID=A0A538T322_UNCEI|nr:MAG: glutamate-1-semialdehyde-2,1-aminomutase [Candidatus Eisenbacteria bacterium]
MKETRALPATRKSDTLHERALGLFPGGVNSPVRAFLAVGGRPRIIASAQGAYLKDADGNELLDYVLGWGPLLLGHAHPAVVPVVERQVRNGVLYGLSTQLEIELAERVRRFYPAAERLRFVSTGTEATMAAIRVARAATRREGFIKFDGAYHGHADAFLIRGGSGLTTFGVPDSAGVPASVAAETRVAIFNDLDSVERAFAREPERIAAVLVEPVVGNMGVIPPKPGFLGGLRGLCDHHGALLVFDEVMSGFRVARGGAAERYGVTPDLVALGKVIGGGLPVAAFGGRADLMKLVAPEGPVYQAGTYSGNPLAMSAGNATLAHLESDPAIFRRVEARTTLLAAGLQEILTRRKVRGVVNAIGSMWTIFFGVDPVSSVEDARRASKEEYAQFFRSMLERGIFLPPSAWESAFLSDAHRETELDRTLEAADEAIEGLSCPKDHP